MPVSPQGGETDTNYNGLGLVCQGQSRAAVALPHRDSPHIFLSGESGLLINHPWGAIPLGIRLSYYPLLYRLVPLRCYFLCFYLFLMRGRVVGEVIAPG